MTTDVNNLIFVGLNSRVAALDQDTGTLVWQWRATTPRSGGYVSLLLLDEARLIVSVVTSIATLGKNNLRDLLLAAAAADAAAAAASAASSGAGTSS